MASKPITEFLPVDIPASTNAPPPHDDDAVRWVARKFYANFPREAAAATAFAAPAFGRPPQSFRWTPPANNDFVPPAMPDGKPRPIRDGTYRVASDWLFTFARGRLVEVSLAVPPDYGGPDVRHVDPNEGTLSR
jgi:hypothetical protein